MLTFLCIVAMLIVAYAYLGEGLFTAFTMFVNVFLAGLVAFDFFEPIADELEPLLDRSFLQGYEDAFALLVLFTLSLGLLRILTNTLNNSQLLFPLPLQGGGAVLFGLATGYLVAGFLVCVLQTLPWHENFISYDPRPRSGLGRVLPPDRVWLAAMRRAGAYTFANREDLNAESSIPEERYFTFDRQATFIPRYARYRRYNDQRGPLPYQGECDGDVERQSGPSQKR
jgi:hypothetical protein